MKQVSLTQDGAWAFPVELPKLTPGMVVAVYTDEGPAGICGQSMSITCPWQEIHIFPSDKEFRAFCEGGKMHRQGRRHRWEYAVIGDHGSGNMWLHIHGETE